MQFSFPKAVWFICLTCKPRLEGAVGGKKSSPLLSYASHFRLDNVIYHKQPRQSQQVCYCLFFISVPLCVSPPLPRSAPHLILFLASVNYISHYI